MKKYGNNLGRWMGALALAAASVLAAQAAPAADTGQTQTAERYLKDIRKDAVQIRSASAQLRDLAAKPGVSWLDYDRQWNEIKPHAEDIQMKLWWLEDKQASLSSEDRNDIRECKTLNEEIQSQTNGLRVLLDELNVQTNDPKFAKFAKALESTSDDLAKTIDIG